MRTASPSRASASAVPTERTSNPAASATTVTISPRRTRGGASMLSRVMTASAAMGRRTRCPATAAISVAQQSIVPGSRRRMIVISSSPSTVPTGRDRRATTTSASVSNRTVTRTLQGICPWQATRTDARPFLIGVARFEESGWPQGARRNRRSGGSAVTEMPVPLTPIALSAAARISLKSCTPAAASSGTRSVNKTIRVVMEWK